MSTIRLDRRLDPSQAPGECDRAWELNAAGTPHSPTNRFEPLLR